MDADLDFDADDIADVFSLCELVVDTEEAQLRHNPLDWVCLTRPQYEFAASEDPEALWCDGNQLGKSYDLAYDLIHTVRGTHPFRPNRPLPVEAMIVSVSLEQMEPLMRKIWELVPKDEIHPDNGFVSGRGITGKPPRIVFVSGPGKGSVIKFATYAQGAARIAGATLDYVAMDEPPEESVYGEIKPRLFRRHGLLRVVMTPTPDMPPQLWYKERVEKGEVAFFNYHLKEVNMQPVVWGNEDVGHMMYDCLESHNVKPFPRPFKTQPEIDKYLDGLLEHERGMRERGDWVALPTGRWLPKFLESKHVHRIRLEELQGWYLVVGCDHGTQAGKQAAVLVAVRDRGSSRPKVRFLAETVGEGLTTPEDDARNIISMLASRGLRWTDVDMWVGDVPAGSYRHEVKKSNNDLRRELAALLKVKLARVPLFKVPKKGRNSMTYGVAFLNTLFARFEEDGTPHCQVDRSCKHFIDFCNRFDGDKWHETKDVGDAGRYAVERAIDGRVIVR